METKSHNNLEKRLNHERELEEDINRLLGDKKHLESIHEGFLLELFVSYGTKAIIEGYNKAGKKYYIEAINYMKEKERVFDITKFSLEKRLLEEGKQAVEDIIEKYEKMKYPYVAGYYAMDSVITDFELINDSPDKEKLIEHNIKMYERSLKNMEDGLFFDIAENISNEAIEFTKCFGLKNKLKEFKEKNKEYQEKKIDISDFSDKEIDYPDIIFINATKKGFKRDFLIDLMYGVLSKIEAKRDYERLKSGVFSYSFLLNDGRELEQLDSKEYKAVQTYKIQKKKRKECIDIINDLEQLIDLKEIITNTYLCDIKKSYKYPIFL